MKIIYAPDNGVEPYEFDFTDVSELAGHECELIEEAGGTQWDTFGGWFDLLSREGYRANKVLVWVLLRRENPSLGLEELVNFKMRDLTVVASDDEVAEGKDESGPEVSVTGDAPTTAGSPTPDLAA